MGRHRASVGVPPPPGAPGGLEEMVLGQELVRQRGQNILGRVGIGVTVRQRPCCRSREKVWSTLRGPGAQVLCHCSFPHTFGDNFSPCVFAFEHLGLAGLGPLTTALVRLHGKAPKGLKSLSEQSWVVLGPRCFLGAEPSLSLEA